VKSPKVFVDHEDATGGKWSNPACGVGLDHLAEDRSCCFGPLANPQPTGRIEQALIEQADVILMDVRMPVMYGITATRQIRDQLPTCQVLMLTTFNDEEYIVKALVAGASGYLLKDIPAQDLAKAIQLAQRGIYQLEPSIVDKLIGAIDDIAPKTLPVSDESPSPQFDELTEREVEVLRLVATGATNREVAEKLVISEGTVKKHVSNILRRLGLRDRIQAAIYVRERHLLS
jgi:DNA-binding NarL/FixJ family response regulator